MVAGLRAGAPGRRREHTAADHKEGKPADILDHGPCQKRDDLQDIEAAFELCLFPSNVRFVSGPILTSYMKTNRKVFRSSPDGPNCVHLGKDPVYHAVRWGFGEQGQNPGRSD